MQMSKLGKKIMAAISAIAMVLSLGSYTCTDTAKAAEAPSAPTVKVLGATLRTDNEIGKQSIRVAIEVSGASNAGACGINMKKDGMEKPITVSTEDTHYNKIYSKDEENDKVVYTVIVSNIPVATDAGTTIEFEGFAKEIGKEDEIKADKTITESVNSIAGSIGEKLGESVKVLTTGDYAGTVVYEYASLDMSKEGLVSTKARNDYGADAKFNTDKGGNAEYKKETEPYYHVSNVSLQGIGYDLRPGDGRNPDDTYIYCSKVKATAGTRLGMRDWNGNDHSNNKELTCNGDWQDLEVKVENTDQGAAYISILNTDVAKEYDLKNFTIYKVVSESDLPEITPEPSGWSGDKTKYSLKLSESTIKDHDSNKKNEYKFNEDGSVTVNCKGGEFWFELPEEAYNDPEKWINSIEIEYRDVSEGVNTGIAARYIYDDTDKDQDWGGVIKTSGSHFEKTYNLSTLTGGIKHLRMFNVPESGSFTITSVTFGAIDIMTPANPAKQGVELIKNGQFTKGGDGLDDWTNNGWYSENGGITVEDDGSEKCCKIKNRANNFSGIKTVLDADHFTKGQVIEYSLDIKVGADYADTEKSFAVNFAENGSEKGWQEFTDESGNKINHLSKEWKHVTGTYTISDDANYMYIVIAEGNNYSGYDGDKDGTHIFYVKNVSMKIK